MNDYEVSVIGGAPGEHCIGALAKGLHVALVTLRSFALVAIYHMFSHQVCYDDLGDLYLDKLNKHHLTRNLLHRLEGLDYDTGTESCMNFHRAGD